MSEQISTNISVECFDEKLITWRSNLFENLEEAAFQAILKHVDNFSSARRNELKVLTSEMNKVMCVASDHVNDLKMYGVHPELIREAILPAIHSLKCPFPSDTVLNDHFEMLQSKIYDCVDSLIIGEVAVNNRNICAF